MVEVLAFNCNGFWKVKFGSDTGYVLPSYLQANAGSVLPTSTKTLKTTDEITLRDIPGTNGEALDKIPNGASVKYYDSAENGFYLVSYNGQMGYALAQYLK